MAIQNPDSDMTGHSTVVIPLAAEELSVGRREVVLGTLRVDVRTTTEDRVVDEALSRQRVEVEHVPIGRVVTSVPAVREEGDTTIIPVVEEVLVWERRLVLKEEIHLRRVRTTENHRETVALRVQEATVTRNGEIVQATAALPHATPPIQTTSTGEL